MNKIIKFVQDNKIGAIIIGGYALIQGAMPWGILTFFFPFLLGITMLAWALSVAASILLGAGLEWLIKKFVGR